MNGLLRITFIFVLFITLAVSRSFAYDASIVVNPEKRTGVVRKEIFGNNIIAYDPTTYENWVKKFYGYSDFGAGIWDSKWNESVGEVVKLAQDAHVTVLRFPGGCGTHHYIWQNTIGKNRKDFLFGIDEFLRICEAVGAEPVITLSYFEGIKTDRAELVEYLNSPDDGNHTWAAKRAQNGHKKPYGVKYFEVGNEDWHGDHRTVKQILPSEYAQRYLKYYSAMKAVDPSVQIGVILWTSEWNRKVMEIVKDKVDFGIIHVYPSPDVSTEKLEKMDPKDIYRVTLAAPMVRDEYALKEALQLLKEKCGKDVSLAITEYNGGFVQEKPVPYRHALGTALVNAELLRIFMKPENNVLMANYWNFVNEYWGMVANGFDGTYRTLRNPYYRRPNYYVFEMYHKHFGEVLIRADVKSDLYDVSQYMSVKSLLKRLKTGTLVKNNLAAGSWEIRDTPGVKAVDKDGVLVLEFLDSSPPAAAQNDDGAGGRTYNYYHSIKKAQVEPGTFYKLSGYIKAENLIDENGVCLEAQDARGWTQTHSAESTEKITGTTEWQYVEAIYATLPDAKEVNVIARRIGETGPLKGKAFFKDVKLEKFIPSIDTKIPYLSVNASKSADGGKIYLMVTNKNMDAAETATIDLKDFVPAPEGNAWVLNGPGVDATNEKKHDNVKVAQKQFKVSGPSFEYTFEPHSLTAIELDREKK